MKNKHLIAAIEFARKLGLIVTRQHADGLTLVTVTDDKRSQSAGRVYKTGSSNPQAVFIKTAAKKFTIVERGVMFRMDSGGVFFHSEKYKVLYRWHDDKKEWRVWLGNYDLDHGFVNTVFRGRWCKASVNCNILRSGVKYHD